MKTLGSVDTGRQGAGRLSEALFARELHQMVDHLDDLFGAARQACRGKELAVDDECRYREHVEGLWQVAVIRDPDRDSRWAVVIEEPLSLHSGECYEMGRDVLVNQLSDIF